MASAKNPSDRQIVEECARDVDAFTARVAKIRGEVEELRQASHACGMESRVALATADRLLRRLPWSGDRGGAIQGDDAVHPEGSVKG